MVVKKKQVAAATAKKWRRLFDSLRDESVLRPHLEKALLIHGEKVWPEEYAIRIHNKERIWDGYFHPSSHCEAPELLLYYMFHPDFRVERDPPTAEQIMTFQIGSAYHALFQSMLIHLGFTFEPECETAFINEEKWVSGSLDVRKLYLPDGRVMPLEIKSTSWLPKEPHPGYISQLQVYMDAGCEEPQEEGLLFYIEKSSPHRFREFLIRRDEKALDRIYSKWAKVREAISFSDPSMLEFPCHDAVGAKDHVTCPARLVCPFGKS